MQGKGKGAKSAAKASKAKSKVSSPKARKAQQGRERLRPGLLDGLVLGYMKKHRGELPVTPSTVAHGIKGRSATASAGSSGPAGAR